MWEFVRSAKAQPELGELDAESAADTVEAQITQWPNAISPRRQCIDSDAVWARCFPESDDPKIEFIQTWDRVFLPAGTDILQVAVNQAQERPLKPSKQHSAMYVRFISIAGHLQRLRPLASILLPEERLAKLLDCKHETVSWYRRLAVKHGLLKELSKHDFVHKRATEFRFRIEWFDWKSGQQIESLPIEQQIYRNNKTQQVYRNDRTQLDHQISQNQEGKAGINKIAHPTQKAEGAIADEKYQDRLRFLEMQKEYLLKRKDL